MQQIHQNLWILQMPFPKHYTCGPMHQMPSWYLCGCNQTATMYQNEHSQKKKYEGYRGTYVSRSTFFHRTNTPFLASLSLYLRKIYQTPFKRRRWEQKFIRWLNIKNQGLKTNIDSLTHYNLISELFF